MWLASATVWSRSSTIIMNGRQLTRKQRRQRDHVCLGGSLVQRNGVISPLAALLVFLGGPNQNGQNSPSEAEVRLFERAGFRVHPAPDHGERIGGALRDPPEPRRPQRRARHQS